MKRILIQQLLFIICLSSAYGQEISIRWRELSDTELELNATFINNSERSISFYKPRESDFCNGIMTLVFSSRQGDAINYPCEEERQSDEIQIRCDNAISLRTGEKFSSKYLLILPRDMVKSTKKISLQLNFRDFKFTGNTTYELFRGILKTEETESDKL